MEIVLFVDPGTKYSAYTIYSYKKIIDSKIVENDHLRKAFYRFFKKNKDIIFGVESIESYGRPVGNETFLTCYYIGRLMEVYSSFTGHDPIIVPRRDVKKHLTGNANSKDPFVRQAVIDLLGPPGTKKNPGPTYGLSADMWQSTGGAIYLHDKYVIR